MNPTRTEAIARFLRAKTHPDLAGLYNPSMEVQVNVAQDGGERIEGEYRGKNWRGWTDGLVTWKPFRIPYHANTNPEYTDVAMNWPFDQHVEAIGMTGWDWKNRLSRWVAYDFDAILGHNAKAGKTLTPEELDEVQNTVQNVPWVTIRRSTGGNGLHLYVFLEPESTANHNEHAALARAILGKLSAVTGFDFESKVDICGGNMWVWHRKMIGTNGLFLIKRGEILTDIPMNWRDHLSVVTGQRKRTKVGNLSDIEQLAGQRQVVKLDDQHKSLLEWLDRTKSVWWWEQDYHMLVTHTVHLRDAHQALGMIGDFQTNSSQSSDQNCFAFPLRDGAWVVRRYTQGVAEAPTWDQDNAGWTRCYLNQLPTLRDASRATGGIEDKKGGFNFREAEVAMTTLMKLGVSADLNSMFASRPIRVSEHKDGRYVLEMERHNTDLADRLPNWFCDKKTWTRIVGSTRTATPNQDSDVSCYDSLVRHLITEDGEDYGWSIFSDAEWHVEPLSHVRIALASAGVNAGEVNTILGSSVFKPWRLVNKPFESEYPGDREWNRRAAALSCRPSDCSTEELSYPTWNKILSHTGSGLDEAVADNQWCSVNGITTGADYLKIWIACMFQKPDQPLPYLFFHGPEESGKSIFHESLRLLLHRGYVHADKALTSNNGFNGELLGQVLCVVEETDLRVNKSANNRIKDWVTARSLQIHEKGCTPYQTVNTTHWVQCANDHAYCPIFRGDTRIVVAYVKPLDPLEVIPKRIIEQRLLKEAPDFLAEILRLEIPESNSRLMIPVIETSEKHQIADMNRDDLTAFLDDICVVAPGHWLKFSDLYERFSNALDPSEMGDWSKIRMGKNLPPQFPKGRDKTTAQWYVGNIAYRADNPATTGKKYVKAGEFLELIDDSRHS